MKSKLLFCIGIVLIACTIISCSSEPKDETYKVNLEKGTIVDNDGKEVLGSVIAKYDPETGLATELNVVEGFQIIFKNITTDSYVIRALDSDSVAISAQLGDIYLCGKTNEISFGNDYGTKGTESNHGKIYCYADLEDYAFVSARENVEFFNCNIQEIEFAGHSTAVLNDCIVEEDIDVWENATLEINGCELKDIYNSYISFYDNASVTINDSSVVSVDIYGPNVSFSISGGSVEKYIYIEEINPADLDDQFSLSSDCEVNKVYATRSDEMGAIITEAWGTENVNWTFHDDSYPYYEKGSPS